MPFIYIHTPFLANKSAKENLLRVMASRLMQMFPEWKLKEEYIHLAFTEEDSSDDKRAIMVKVEALYNEDIAGKKEEIIQQINAIVAMSFSKKDVRSIITFFLKENTGFAST